MLLHLPLPECGAWKRATDSVPFTNVVHSERVGDRHTLEEWVRWNGVVIGVPLSNVVHCKGWPVGMIFRHVAHWKGDRDTLALQHCGTLERGC